MSSTYFEQSCLRAKRRRVVSVISYEDWISPLKNRLKEKRTEMCRASTQGGSSRQLSSRVNSLKVL
jgi:hypothetical protein